MPAKRVLRGLPTGDNEREYKVEHVMRYDEARDLYAVKQKECLAKTLEPIENLKNRMTLVNKRR